MKKIYILLILFIMLFFCSYEPAIAQVPECSHLHDVYQNLYVQDTSPKGFSKPTKIWNVSTKGKFVFRGSFNENVTYYSNYLFSGKNKYTMYFENQATKALKISVLSDKNKLIKTINLSSKQKCSFSLEYSNSFYIKIYGKSFNGYIK